MLPLELLRTRTSRGRIYPLFCTARQAGEVAGRDAEDDSAEGDHKLASEMISIFEYARRKGMSRGELSGILSETEPDHDYKLVRGLGILLERRSSFAMRRPASAGVAPLPSPHEVRQAVFAASSRMGLAISPEARVRITAEAAKTCGVPDAGGVSELMWADLDENHVVDGFDTMSADDLLLWYNMSLAQTLLFRCVRLEFSIAGGGHEWRSVLRAVKMNGLMYALEAADDKDGGRGVRHPSEAGGYGILDRGNSVRCILDGPLSMFKMTTRYGTAFARLLPSITRTSDWEIDATISKNTSSGPKLYRFELSSKASQNHLRATCGAPPGRGGEDGDGHDESYDSSVEQMFAAILRQHLDRDAHLGWRMIREPGPLVAGNKAMLPDFAFERLGRRVYLEIVGFWTPDYIKRKVAKLREILGMQDRGRDGDDFQRKGADPRSVDTAGAKVDMLVGIDSSLLCSSQASELGGMPGVFAFGRSISVKPVLDRLKEIDAEIEKDVTTTAQIPLGDLGAPVLSIRDLAVRYGIPENVVPSVLAKSAPDSYLKAGPYMLSAAKISQVSGMLEDVREFAGACGVLDRAGIPAESHADALSLCGYDVVWKDLNPENTTIIKRTGAKTGW